MNLTFWPAIQVEVDPSIIFMSKSVEVSLNQILQNESNQFNELNDSILNKENDSCNVVPIISNTYDPLTYILKTQPYGSFSEFFTNWHNIEFSLSIDGIIIIFI